jgi:hypothetical protein
METKINFDEQREKDIQKLCQVVLDFEVKSTGDYGMGGECPFCGRDCPWDACLQDIKHEFDCAYLIAKDLAANFRNKTR